MGAPSGPSGRVAFAGGWGEIAGYDGGVDTNYWAAVVWALAPTVVVLGLFIFVLRSILRMDRSERRMYAKVEAEERAKRGLPPASDAPTR